MNRFFISEEQINRDKIFITGEDFRHITKSLRMKIGEKVEVSTGKKDEYIGKIINISGEYVELKIEEIRENKTESPIQITLYQGLPKGSKFDLIIQKCVELGVFSIVPLNTQRSIVDLSKKASKKIERWQKIAEEAAKQSKRGIIPKVRDIINIRDLEDFLFENDLNIIAYEEEEKTSIKELLKSRSNLKKIGVIIGPEGGLAEDEVEFLKSIGGKTATLGNRILRTETAGIAVLSMLAYEYEL